MKNLEGDIKKLQIEVEKLKQDHLLHEDKKAWEKYFWMLNNSWEREKSLDQFSYNVVRLFTVLNSTSIGGILAIIASNPDVLSSKKEIIYTSFVHWTWGLTASLVCFLLWYIEQAFNINESEEQYKIMIGQNDKKTPAILEKTQLLRAFLVVCSGMATGIFL